MYTHMGSLSVSLSLDPRHAVLPIHIYIYIYIYMFSSKGGAVGGGCSGWG